MFYNKVESQSERAVGIPSSQKWNQLSTNPSSELKRLIIQEYKLSCTRILNNFLPENRYNPGKCWMTFSLQRTARANLWTGQFIQKQQ